MSGIRGKDTSIEIQVRKGLHRDGFRFRLHDRKLPGRPDLVLAKHDAVIQVNGCFWHGHDCALFKMPSSNRGFWEEKIGRNRERDLRNRALLSDKGWRLLEVWECSIRGSAALGLSEVVARAGEWLVGDSTFRSIRAPKNPLSE